jgi:hypothetical protein
MASFGVFFVGQSFPIYSNQFVQTGTGHFVIDVTATVNPDFS